MSRKNSNVILKSRFENFKDLNEIYLNFKKNLDDLKKRSFVVAISGGPDSLALAAFTKTYKYYTKAKFFYVLIDHRIRKNSTKEANAVKSLLKKNNIHLDILTNKKKIINNVQGNARKIRYEMISKYSKKRKSNTILTAHNLEDQVETFFIRLSRGSGLTGLSAMRPLSKLNNNLNLYRPFLNIKKKFLIKTSKIVFGKYFKDPSNKNKAYLRTKIRSLKKPLERSGINYDQIIKSINNLSSSKSILEDYYKKITKEVITKSRKEILVNLKKLKIYDNEIKIKVINDSIKLLKKNYYNPRSKKVLNLIKKLNQPNFKKSTLGGCLMVKKKDYLSLKTEKVLIS